MLALLLLCTGLCGTPQARWFGTGLALAPAECVREAGHFIHLGLVVKCQLVVSVTRPNGETK